MTKYTDEQKTWCVQHFNDYDCVSELCNAFNERFDTERTVYGITQLCSKTLNLNRDKYFYPAEQDEWLIEHALDYPTIADIAIAFKKKFDTKRSVKTIVYHYSELKKKKLMPNRPGTTHYGQKPKEQLPVGSIRKSQTGTYIKVRECPEWGTGRRSGYKPPYWLPLQYKLYTDKHGELPHDKFVVFLDGDTNNFSLDNLYPIDRKISAVMSSNGWWSSEPKKTMAAIKWCELHYTIKEVNS